MEKDSYEGACGQIVATADPNVVIKRVYKKATPTRRIKSHRARMQWLLQNWAFAVCTPQNGFQTLWVPQAWNPQDHEYTMYRIHVGKQILPSEFAEDPKLVADLQLLYKAGFRAGYYPCDFELYRQPDGSVAMVDYDKFGWWRPDGTVEFPWGQVWSSDQVKEYTPVSI